MSNISNRYNGGTFEGLFSSWNSIIQTEIFNGVTRSADFAHQGAYSCRLQTKIISGQLFYDTLFDVVPISTKGVYYEFKVRFRLTAGLPDNLLLFLTADIADESPSSENSTKVIAAAQAKDDWQELSMVFKAKEVPFSGGALVYLRICTDIGAFLSANPQIAQAYPNLTNYDNEVDMVAGEFIYLDTLESRIYPASLIAPDQIAGRSLYHVKNVFFLSNGLDIFEIDEPIGWDKVLLTIDFDRDTYRYKYEFTDKDIVLQFDESAGRSILKAIWEELGVDGIASLKFGELDEDDVLTIHYEGDLNFAAYKADKYVVKMSCEKRGAQVAFQTRINVPVSVDAEETLEGTALTPLTKRTLYLNSLLLKSFSEYKGNANSVNIDEIPLTEEKPNPLDFIYTSVPLLQISKNNAPGLSDPYVPDGSFLYTGTLPASSGKRRLVISAGVKFNATLGGSGQPMHLGLIIYKLSNITNPSTPLHIPYNVVTPFHPDYGGIEGESYTDIFDFGDVEIDEEETKIANLEIVQRGFILDNDEALFIKIFIVADNLVEIPIEGAEWLNPENWYMTIEESTIRKPTTVDVYPIHELINRQLEIVTDKVGILKSDFLGRLDLGYDANGCGSNYGAITGEQMRGFDKPMNLSSRNWITSLGSLFCLGISLERDNLNNEFMRVEPLPFFFRDVEIMYFPIITDYSEEAAEEFMFNELEFGYSKFLNNNQPGSRKDFMNKKQYLTTFKTLKNKLPRPVDWILSSQYINLTLQQNIVDNPDNAYETDKDIFLIHHKHEPVTSWEEDVDIVFDAATKTITISSTNFPIKEGDTITILGTDSNNGPKTIVSIDLAIPFWTYIEVSEVLVDETKPSASMTFGERYIPKHDEDFESYIGVNPTSGTIDNQREAATMLNLRHHVKRIAQRWSKVFMTGQPSEVKFIDGQNNDGVESQLAEDAECKYMDNRGDSTGELFTWMQTVKDSSNDSFSADLFGIWDKPLFGKNKYPFSVPMSWDVWNELRKAFEGRHPDGKDYGYISFMDPFGQVKKAYLLSGKFDPIKNMCKLETIEKGTYYST